MCPLQIKIIFYLEASSTATAHATVAPTIGLLPKLNLLINACYYVLICLNMYCEKAVFPNGAHCFNSIYFNMYQFVFFSFVQPLCNFAQIFSTITDLIT